MKYGWTIVFPMTSGAKMYVMQASGRPFWFDSASEALNALEGNQDIKMFKEKYPWAKLRIERCVKVGEDEWSQFFM